MHRPTASGQWAETLRVQCDTTPGAVGSGIVVMHCHIVWGQWQGTPRGRLHTTGGQWAVKILQCTTTLPGAVGSGTAVMHRRCGVVWCGVV